MGIIFIFTRDLRINDHEGLNEAVQKAKELKTYIYPIFVFTHEQIDKNEYVNHRSITFMCECLEELSDKINMTFFHGTHLKILSDIIKTNDITDIFMSYDVSPYARIRNKNISELCSSKKVSFHEYNDVHVCRKRNLYKKNGQPYMKYTPFYQNALRYINSEKIFPDIDTKLFKVLGSSNKKLIKKFAGKSTVNFYGGRSEALKKIESYKKSHVNYLAIRDLPAENATTHLSAYLHFGVISPLEVVFMIKNKDIKKQILWREFYLYIIEHMPDYSKNSLTIERNNKIKWKGKNFKKWCDGQTGIPFIDAGMRELNETGYMQNRMRMNVAMFLIFYLQVDWRQGEQYFAQNLVDYDYCNNLGGWLWSSSWEVHSNDYYRVFSMSSQMQRFDKDGEYVKKWVPELKDIPVKHLYDWDKNYMNYDLKKLGYCPPLITDLSQSRREGIELYRA